MFFRPILQSEHRLPGLLLTPIAHRLEHWERIRQWHVLHFVGLHAHLERWVSESVYQSVSERVSVSVSQWVCQSVSQTGRQSVSIWRHLSDLRLPLRLWHSCGLSSALYIQSLKINSLDHLITFFSFIKTAAERLSILNHVTVCMHITLCVTIDWLLLHSIMTES